MSNSSASGGYEDARLGMNGKQLYVQNLLISWVCTSIFSLLLSLYRSIPEANLSTHQGLLEKKKFKGLEIKGKKIGLIGFRCDVHCFRYLHIF